jgi:hypothetical protein
MKKTTENGAKALLNRLEETAFFAHYSLLGDGNVRQYDWEKLGAKMTGLEKDLWGFFLLSQPRSKKEVLEMLGQPALDFLLHHKLCTTVKGKLSMGILRLVRFWGLTLFIERGASAASFIGDDTKALLAFLPKLNKGRCLSMFTAGGLEVLPLTVAPQVELTFTGIKTKEGILSANLELNAMEGAKQSWKFAASTSGEYDLIVSNPPCLFEPPGVKIPKFASGGPDGLKSVRKFMEAASTKLKPGGLAISSFAYFSDVDNTLMEQRLRAFLAPYGMNYVIAVASKLLMESGVPVFNQLVSAAVHGPKPPQMEAVVKRTMEYIDEKKFGAVHLLKGRFWKGAKGQPLEQQITNYSDSYYGTWII